MPLGHTQRFWRDKHGQAAIDNLRYCLKCHEADAKYNYEGKPSCLLCHNEKAMAGFRTRSKDK